MVRAAAKNYTRTAIVVSPKHYDEVIAEIKDEGKISLATREKLAPAGFSAYGAV